jgi:transposase-like protein
MLRVITVQSYSTIGRGSMVKFRIITPVVEEFIFLLEQQEGIRWKKIWYINGKTIGVFFIEVFSSLSADSALLNIVIDHDQKEKRCQIWIEPFGTGIASPDKAMKEIIRAIGNISMSNEWHFERLPTKYGGNTCPYCKATYRYKKELNQQSSTRTCQNCGKQFEVEEPIETEGEQGDIRSRRMPCPYCEATYTYKKKHIQENGMVVCQNCGESFVLQIDDWTRYSYDWYQEEEEDNQ